LANAHNWGLGPSRWHRAIWATIASAQREIAANQAQTKVAQDQLATTLRLERRRNLRDGHAFLAMLEAAMGSVIADVIQARMIASKPKRRDYACARRRFLSFGMRFCIMGAI
jgi:hypothetical protein